MISNKLLRSNFTVSYMELSKYLSYYFLRNEKKRLINKRSKTIFHSVGQITRTSHCDSEASSIYSSFWYAYLFENGRMKFNCTSRICLNEINSKCFMFGTRVGKCHVIHIKKPPCRDVEQSKIYKFSPCCDFVNSFTENFEATLKLMKYSVQSIHFQDSADEENRVFGEIEKAFEPSSFNLKPRGPATRRNFNNLIPLCQYAGIPEEMRFANCDLFRRSFSNLGLSFTFNADKFWQIYQKSEYTKLFERVMAPETEQPIRFPTSSGTEYGLKFLLNGSIHIHNCTYMHLYLLFLFIFSFS